MTAQDIINRAKLTFPDATDTVALSYLQDIHDDLCWLFKINPSDVTETSLVSGTANYDLPTGTARIFSCRYVRSATAGDWKELEPTHIDALDALRRDWRKQSDSEPEYFYVEDGDIHLHPAPDTSSSGSPAYPRLEMQVSLYETLLVGTTLAEFPNYNAWITGLRMKLAEHFEDTRFQMYERQYEMQKKRLGGQTVYRAAHFAPSLVSSHARTGGRRKA